MLNSVLDQAAEAEIAGPEYRAVRSRAGRLAIPVAAPLSRQQLLDLAQRSKFDCFYFLLAAAAIPFFERRVLDSRPVLLFSVLSILSNVSMWLYFRYWPHEVASSPRRAIRVFSILKCCQNLSLSCEVAWVILVFGINAVTSLATPMLIAFAQATLISLRPNGKVLRFTICCCLMPTIGASLWAGGRPGYGIALLLSIDLIYLWIQGNREHLEYLRAVQHTHELRRARRKATQEGARMGDALLANAARHTATVAERNRIAYEWHDTLLAGFSAISWQLDEARLRQHGKPAQAIEAIELARSMVRHYRAEARLVIADLLYEESGTQDLVSLIEQEVAKGFSQETIDLQVRHVGTPLLLPPDITRQLLRICQEAAANSVRHAHPSRIEIRLEFRLDQITVSVADDGCGFIVNSSKPSHFGLQIMKQRARRLGGELSIQSGLDEGTRVSVTVPYQADFSKAPTRILVIEDQYFSRLALHTVIDSYADIKIVSEADTGFTGIEAFREQRPDVTIIDLKLPDQSGIEVIKTLRKMDPTARIVVLSNFDGSEYLHRATEAGAMAYLTKDSNAEELLDAIRAVRVGQSFIPASLLHLLESHVSGNELTTREQGVLELLVFGWSNKQIGEQLGIAEKTVRIHLSSIFPSWAQPTGHRRC